MLNYIDFRTNSTFKKKNKKKRRKEEKEEMLDCTFMGGLCKMAVYVIIYVFTTIQKNKLQFDIYYNALLK